MPSSTDGSPWGWGCADLADAMALDAAREQLVVTAKDDGSFVTQTDRAIETLIRDRIGDAFPAHGVVGEEHGETTPDASVRWFVDPIDGTHNFMRGVPLFGTLLAAERDGDLVVGVVSAPAIGRRWWARRGGGAWVREPGGRPPRPIPCLEPHPPRRVAGALPIDARGARIAGGSGARGPPR